MVKMINCLGIETSCDETAAAVVNSDYKIISNIIFSQQKLHSSYFGVVPELASRAHYEKIGYVVDKVLKKFNIKKISLIAYTEKPGLKGSLLIGKTAAKTLGYIFKIPTIGVDHLWGHIHSVILSQKGKIELPFISLVISGGHTELSIVESFTERKVLGETRDDAVGEAFDKVAKLLYEKTKNKVFKYPGGPVIEKLAKFGDPKSINFPRPYMLDNWDFSFSGIKTAVVYYVNSLKTALDNKLVYDICASFQEAVVDTIYTKLLYAIEKLGCDTVCISGGVSANNYLRKKLKSLAKTKKTKVYFPEKKLATDNAAMIASAGIQFCISENVGERLVNCIL
jgi:N6-L-threonylcarbamoyladenine synthase